MELKYVGDKPIVSKHGVSFDQTKPDKYTLLNAAVELLDALDSGAVDESGVLDLREYKSKRYDEKELVKLLNKYHQNMDEISKECEVETNALIDDLVKKVKSNSNINADERSAWLGNIAIMRNYYLQYVTNEHAYNAFLRTLAGLMVEKHIHEILFPLYRNYGMVLSHLLPVLTDHRPPVDAVITVEEKNGVTFGKLKVINLSQQ
jgi:hypothetical protein